VRLPVRARSYAVLIGTSHYRSAELVDLPAVATNLADLADVLTDPALGWLDRDRCVVIEDATDVRAVYRILRTYAEATEDTLLVYFAGHGRVGPRNELFLGLTDTDPDELPVSALAYDLVRDVLADSPAANRVVVLDCCFSGRAVVDMAGDLMGQLGVTGTYVLAATPPNAVALAPLGARHTAFTGLLLALLRTGVPDAPALLSLAVIHRELLHAAVERGLPRPQQRGTGTSQHLALTRNVGRGTAAVTRPPAPRVRRRSRYPWGRAVFGAIVVAVLVAAVLMVRSVVLGWVDGMSSGSPTSSYPPPDPRQLGQPVEGEARFVAYAPDGRLVTGGDQYLRIWGTAGYLSDSIDDPGGGNSLKTAVFSADSSLLAISSWESGVYLYDLGQMDMVAGPFGDEHTEALAFNSDSTLLAIGNTDDVDIWDLRGNRQLGTVPVPDLRPQHNNRTTGLAFSPADPNVLAVESLRSTQLWNARTRAPLGEPVARRDDVLLGVEGQVSFSADGGLLAAHGALWAVDRRAPVCDPDAVHGSVEALSPDGRTAAVTNEYAGTKGETRLLDIATCSWVGEPLPYGFDVAFSPDSRTLATASLDDTTRWNVAR
jgi:hypothetical protein